jgi:hypothetical protein
MIMLAQTSRKRSNLGFDLLSLAWQEKIASQTKKTEDNGKVCVSMGISQRLRKELYI